MKSIAIALGLCAALTLTACGEHGEPTGSVCPSPPTLTYVNFGKPFMDTYCVDCHSSTKTGAARHGAPAFHDYDTVEGVRQTIEHTVAPFGPVTGSEDFAYYLERKPGCFLRLGNGENAPMLHNARYDFNDGNLTVGAAYWTRLVERYLAQEPAAG